MVLIQEQTAAQRNIKLPNFFMRFGPTVSPVQTERKRTARIGSKRRRKLFYLLFEQLEQEDDGLSYQTITVSLAFMRPSPERLLVTVIVVVTPTHILLMRRQKRAVTHRLLGLAFQRFAVRAVFRFGWFTCRPVFMTPAADVLRGRQKNTQVSERRPESH